MKTDLPVMHAITRIKKEAQDMRTIYLKGKLSCKPGQFIMVWLPGVDEKPMAISELRSNEFGFTYHTIGTFTRGLDSLKVGSLLGIRGPYGNSFSQKKKAVVVGGGVGMASVATLIDVLDNPIVIHGAKTKFHILYKDRFKDMIITTDDGSEGEQGFVTVALKRILETKKVNIVYTCGNEFMMKAVVEMCTQYKVPCEASIERYMKCGFGICGACVMGDKVVCTDGPIFTGKELSANLEFGKCARLKTGKRVSLKEYYGV